MYAKPGIAQDPLHCPIELTGIDPSMTIYIDRCPPPPPSLISKLRSVTDCFFIFCVVDSTSSSSSTASISQTRRETEESMVDINIITH